MTEWKIASYWTFNDEYSHFYVQIGQSILKADMYIPAIYKSTMN